MCRIFNFGFSMVLVSFLVFALSGCTVIFQKGRRSDIEKISQLKGELSELERAKAELDDRLKKEISDKEVNFLSGTIQKIVSTVTHIEDVFVYANSSQIKINIAPVEVFIEMSNDKIKDADKLIEDITSKLSDWKTKENFKHSINLTLISMDWKVKTSI